MPKTDILPRQARDKHRESTQTPHANQTAAALDLATMKTAPSWHWFVDNGPGTLHENWPTGPTPDGTTSGSQVRKRSLFPPFMLKTDILPRQARDKHRENSKKRCRFIAEPPDVWWRRGCLDLPRGRRAPRPAPNSRYENAYHVTKTGSGQTQAKLSKRETRFLTGLLLLHFGVESTIMQRIGAASATTKLAGINEVASAWHYDRAVIKKKTHTYPKRTLSKPLQTVSN
jgi:hypothetical protein